MPHINQNPIDEKLYSKLFTELEKLLSRVDDKSTREVLLALLTPTEQIMLTKRLSVVLFLHKGMTSYEVWNTLKLSPSTVSRISKDYRSGMYAPVIKVLSKNATKEFLKIVELLLGAGLPPRTKDRWQHVSGFNQRN